METQITVDRQRIEQRLQMIGMRGDFSAELRGRVTGGGPAKIIDWKSNDLGGTAACYAPAQLGAEIAAHAYHLQTLLYTLAVHRYLRLHVPNYNYARHFGG